MATRKTWVPLHSIIVVRDDKQVDAYQEYQKTGKAFSFTDDEVTEIQAHEKQTGINALRSPNDEAPADTTPVVSPGTDDAPVAGGKEVARTDDAKAASADKDSDL